MLVKTFKEAKNILGRNGTTYDNVLLFISDATRYILEAGQTLFVVCLKTTLFTYVAYMFHLPGRWQGEITLSRFSDFISKKAFLKTAGREHMSKETYREIPLPPNPIFY